MDITFAHEGPQVRAILKDRTILGGTTIGWFASEKAAAAAFVDLNINHEFISHIVNRQLVLIPHPFSGECIFLRRGVATTYESFTAAATALREHAARSIPVQLGPVPGDPSEVQRRLAALPSGTIMVDDLDRTWVKVGRGWWHGRIYQDSCTFDNAYILA